MGIGGGIRELLEMLSPMQCSVAMHKKVLKVILVILCVNSSLPCPSNFRLTRFGSCGGVKFG
jgi:hypothetical protein